MALPLYLAMIAAEIQAISPLPPKSAYMACHFSPYGRGLSNCPKVLPPDAMLILNDRIPIQGHSPERIGEQLMELHKKLAFRCLLLDFQRPGCEETATLAAHLCKTLPCPVGVSDHYAQGLNCPVFLSAPPLDLSLAKYLDPWNNREIWLEAALDGLAITVTESGSVSTPLSPEEIHAPFHAPELHCHYHIHTEGKLVRFSLIRTREDLDTFLEEAESLGVTNAAGLYQQLQKAHFK